MSRILRLTKSRTTRARSDATSGWVVTRIRSGERCVCAVLKMLKVVVTILMVGVKMDGGRKRER